MCEQLVEGLRLPPAEVFPALLASEPGERAAGVQLELLVGIGEGALEEPGQASPDGGPRGPARPTRTTWRSPPGRCLASASHAALAFEDADVRLQLVNEPRIELVPGEDLEGVDGLTEEQVEARDAVQSDLAGSDHQRGLDG